MSWGNGHHRREVPIDAVAAISAAVTRRCAPSAPVVGRAEADVVREDDGAGDVVVTVDGVNPVDEGDAQRERKAYSGIR
jgi:hypothetical protein